MSLLDKSNTEVTVYLEEVGTDADGNVITRPSTTGITTRAHVHVAAASGTSARRAEQDNEGFEGELAYGLYFPRSFPHVLHAQSQVEWPVGSGQRWAVIGDRHQHLATSNTTHINYTMRRS